ncbi:MAG TPA: chorismate-binding protein, partial [Myxococcota bacterium]|nr:chorismate-binding protein [Myxococcota bacterium]
MPDAARRGAPSVVFHARDAGPARGLLEEFEALRRGAYPWLLDSGGSDRHLGRFSFAGADPWAVLCARGSGVELDVRRAVHPDWPVGRHRVGDDVFAALRQIVPSDASGDGGASDAIPFVGGAVGYLGYELVERLERVRLSAREGAPFADAAFLLVDALLAYDHGAGRLWRCGLGFGADAPAARAAAEARVADLAHASEPTSADRRAADVMHFGPFATHVRKRHDAASYGAVVDVVKEAIAAGEVYQACLTHRIETDFVGNPWRLYQNLRLTNPAPFAAYFDLPEGAILSSSPERFLRVDGEGRVEARPIKGTSAGGPGRA